MVRLLGKSPRVNNRITRSVLCPLAKLGDVHRGWMSPITFPTRKQVALHPPRWRGYIVNRAMVLGMSPCSALTDRELLGSGRALQWERAIRSDSCRSPVRHGGLMAATHRLTGARSAPDSLAQHCCCLVAQHVLPPPRACPDCHVKQRGPDTVVTVTSVAAEQSGHTKSSPLPNAYASTVPYRVHTGGARMDRKLVPYRRQHQMVETPRLQLDLDTM